MIFCLLVSTLIVFPSSVSLMDCIQVSSSGKDKTELKSVVSDCGPQGDLQWSVVCKSEDSLMKSSWIKWKIFIRRKKERKCLTYL